MELAAQDPEIPQNLNPQRPGSSRYRDSWERPAPMVPGEVYAITIELFPIANLFGRGHRLRLGKFGGKRAAGRNAR